MLVSDIINDARFKLVTNEDYIFKEVNGIYSCDLLSHVISKAQEDNVFITVQNNLNSLAVASLLDIGCVILPDNIKVDEIFISKADDEEIPVITTNLNAVEIILALKEKGL